MASFWSNLFGQATSDNEPSASVLAEWNKYSTDTAGPSSARTQSDRLLGKMEEGGTHVQNFVSSSYTRLQTGAQGMGSSLGTTIQSVQMPSTTQFTYFFAMFAAGVVFLVLAFSIFLPVIILAPAKFALCFTLGSALCMAAFLMLKGWRTQLYHMFSAERLPFSVGYLGSMAGTLYAALVMHSYVMSLVCCAAQMVALLYYTLSYFPGGTMGVRFVLQLVYGACMQCFSGVRAAVFR
ncbi:hypothetical protein WJX81_001131 [Elliptochloris bilobata]|uniref:Vesicle transport protein n=1 Tax=Elliptochloris bilobata TaxID=381761 RepID=A0AAW1RQF3_9CHLO